MLIQPLYRQSYNIGVKLRAHALMTLPDSTSQKFVLLGEVSRQDQTRDIKPVVAVFLDFSKTRTKKCEESDYERWYARPADTECLMGRKVGGFVVFFFCVRWLMVDRCGVCIAMVSTPKSECRLLCRGEV